MRRSRPIRSRSEPEYTTLDYTRWTWVQKWLRIVLSAFFRLMSRLEVTGSENIPEGPVLLVSNHVHWLDAPLYFAVLPRPTVLLVSHNWRDVPLIGWFFDNAVNAIYVNRQSADHGALKKALKVLRAGGALGMCPEGTFGESGKMIAAKVGVAFLAHRAPAPVVPMAVYGHERAAWYWGRLRRVPICVQISQPISFLSGRGHAAELEKTTHAIMSTVAGMLPPEYRGVYGQETAIDTPACDETRLPESSVR